MYALYSTQPQNEIEFSNDNNCNSYLKQKSQQEQQQQDEEESNKNIPIHLQKLDKEAVLEAGRQAGWWSSMNLSTGDLMGDSMDASEEEHMSLPPPEMDQDKIEFITTACLPFNASRFRTTARSATRLPVGCPASQRTLQATTAAINRAADFPSRTTTFIEGSSIIRNNEENHDTTNNILLPQNKDLRLRGECYPRYSLETFCKDDCHPNIQLLFASMTQNCSSNTSSLNNDCIMMDDNDSSSSSSMTTSTYEDEQDHFLTMPEYSDHQHRQQQANDEASRINIVDQQRVLSAAEQGSTLVLNCSGCRKRMLTTMDAELVYCPTCGTLTDAQLFQ